MKVYALRRTLQTFPIVFIISLLLFFLVRAAPGGPLTAARRNPNITIQQFEALEEKLEGYTVSAWGSMAWGAQNWKYK